MRARRCRVHRIPPRVRDDRDTPLSWGETARVLDLIWVKREAEYFCEQDWTTQIRLIPFNKFTWLDSQVLANFLEEGEHPTTKDERTVPSATRHSAFASAA
ncbi:hypothetical protein [Bradyrhizobium sp. URHD0069]|uniref:hypothetical protein n=1 Tax=Bradyrhizobium sp. URHD0069 TaxID=1380355 RepID=UPI000496C7E2|nr:hypothetical protein [Bradyrhizobium sp. URHD0069]